MKQNQIASVFIYIFLLRYPQVQVFFAILYPLVLHSNLLKNTNTHIKEAYMDSKKLVHVTLPQKCKILNLQRPLKTH